MISSLAGAMARPSPCCTVKIEDRSAASSRFNTEIRNFDKEVAENQAALGSAIAIRQKELAKFNAEEKDLLLSMDSFVELWLCCR